MPALRSGPTAVSFQPVLCSVVVARMRMPWCRSHHCRWSGSTRSSAMQSPYVWHVFNQPFTSVPSGGAYPKYTCAVEHAIFRSGARVDRMDTTAGHRADRAASMCLFGSAAFAWGVSDRTPTSRYRCATAGRQRRGPESPLEVARSATGTLAKRHVRQAHA